jgi:hypothetical protein
MNRQIFVLAVLIPLALVPVANGQTRETKFADCQVTVPRATPDSLHSNLGLRNAYWNGNLYAATVSPDGTLVLRPQDSPDGSLGMKFPWFRAAGLTGQLTITGRRLDAAAPPLKALIPRGYADTGFQSTGLIFSTEGCWEITGKVDDTTLTFVNRVIREE